MIKDTTDFKQWLTDLKLRIRRSQIKAAIRVSSELLHLYWDLGHDITVRQMDAVWGSGFFDTLSKELKAEFPDMKGFSITNLKYCKQFYLFYTQDLELLYQTGANSKDTNRRQFADNLQIIKNEYIINHQQLVDDFENLSIALIPWGHHVQIFTKCKCVQEAMFYVQKTIKNGWSRGMLMNFIEADLYSSQGKALNNFDRLLPDVQSELAKEMLKDPYNFDFLTLTENFREKEFEDALVTNITRFLLELGQGFAYLGRQFPIQIGSKERNIDLLFYHLKLRCYVVIELKVKEFEPEYAGKLSYYVTAVNHQLKQTCDNPSIGLLICKTKDNVDVQYALESCTQPVGVSEYKLSKLVPDNLKSSLPSIAEIEDRLKGENL